MRWGSDEFPRDRNLALTEFSDHTKSTMRQVNGIGVFTSGAFIRDDHGDGLAILRVGDLHRLSTNVLVKDGRIFDKSEFN